MSYTEFTFCPNTERRRYPTLGQSSFRPIERHSNAYLACESDSELITLRTSPLFTPEKLTVMENHMCNEFSTNPDRLVFLGCMFGWLAFAVVNMMH